MCAFIICTGLWLWGAAASTILANLPLFLAHAWYKNPSRRETSVPSQHVLGHACPCRSTTSRRRTGFQQPGAMSELRTRTGSSVLAFRPCSSTHATSSSASFIAGFGLLSRWLLSNPPARRCILHDFLTKCCCSRASSTTTHDRTCGPMPPFRNRHRHIPTGREGKAEFILCCWCLEPPFPTISLFVCSICEPDPHFRHPPLVARESRTVSSTFNTPKIWAAVYRFANFQTPGTDVENTPHCLQKQTLLLKRHLGDLAEAHS